MVQLPDGMSKGEVVLILRQKRLKLTKRVIATKAEIRALRDKLELDERNLRDIEDSLDLLRERRSPSPTEAVRGFFL
jgi:hypothetical protein